MGTALGYWFLTPAGTVLEEGGHYHSRAAAVAAVFAKYPVLEELDDSEDFRQVQAATEAVKG